MIIGRSVGLNKQPSRQQFILLIYVLTVQPFFSQLSSASDCKCVHCFQAICMYPASKALHFHVGRMWPACDRRRAKCGPHGIARLCCLGRKFNDIGQLLLAGPGMVFYPQITSLENVFFLFFFLYTSFNSSYKTLMSISKKNMWKRKPTIATMHCSVIRLNT